MSQPDEENVAPLPARVDPSNEPRIGDAPPFADFVKNLPPEFQEAFRGVEGNPQIMSIFATAFSASMYAGPLPPPDQLKAYEDVLPGAADRIIRMAENQADHRQAIEKVAVSGGSRRSWWGLWTGFAISVIALGLAALLVLKGHDWAGVSLGTIDLVALASVFVIGRADQRKERVQKDQSTRLPAPAPPPLQNGGNKGISN